MTIVDRVRASIKLPDISWKVMRYDYNTSEKLRTTFHRWRWSALLAAFLAGPFTVTYVHRV